MKKIASSILSLAMYLLFVSTPTIAATNSVSESCSIPLQKTDWKITCDLKKFNPGLGELKKTDLEFSGYVEGVIKLENKENSSKVITAVYENNLKISKENGNIFMEIPAKLSFSETLPSYDGNTDYSGNSGRISSKLNNNGLKQQTLTGADLDQFIGSGELGLSAASTGSMVVSGGSNAASDWDTSARAKLTAIYTYEGYDLSIKITHKPGTYNKGNDISFIITVANQDSVDFSGNIDLIDSLPNDLSYVSGGGDGWDCSGSGQSAKCSANKSLKPGEKTQFTLTAKISDTANGVVTNSAKILVNGDANLNNNSTSDWIIVGKKSTTSTINNKTKKSKVVNKNSDLCSENDLDCLLKIDRDKKEEHENNKCETIIEDKVLSAVDNKCPAISSDDKKWRWISIGAILSAVVYTILLWLSRLLRRKGNKN